MKKKFYSVPVKLILHLCLFLSTLTIVLSACSVINYFGHFNLNEAFTETADFEERYGKYVERVAAYIQYKERGFVTDLSRYTDMNLPIDSYYFITDKDDDQKVYEFYDKKLNFDLPNFLYYVKNLKTGAQYCSPHLKEVMETASCTQNMTEPDAIQYFISNIESNPAYFILNTKKMVYSTNVNHWGYISTSNVDWVVQCITGRLYAGNNLMEQPAITEQSQTTGQISTSPALASNNEFIVYTGIIPDFPEKTDDFASLYRVYTKLSNSFSVSRYLLPASIMLFLFFFLLTIAAAGHSNRKEGIHLLAFDRFPTEPALALAFVMPFFMILGVSYIISLVYIQQLVNDNEPANIIIVFTSVYPCTAFFFYGFIRRFKSHTFFTSCLLYHLGKKMQSGWKRFTENKKLTYTAAICLAGFSAVLAAVFLLYRSHPLLSAALFLLTICAAAFLILRTASDINIIVEETKKISDGDLNHKIPSHNLHGPMKHLGSYINHIGDGLSAAVDEKLKSERLKTQLITNVSHDIKTPLTSIINYVDILNKLHIEDPAAKNYIDVLKAKSWRLKTLIEDLVEASKASSGSISLHMEKLNIVELVRQTAGEFDDRFLEKNLEPVLTIEKDPVYILADGRSTFRIIENLFSNVTKYTLKNTRVYIDITTEADKYVSIHIKNISVQKLNIPSDELMERFVRGDIARSTEGSGLGLSIAKSLASLMNADFKICLDGDLFKAILTFEIIP